MDMNERKESFWARNWQWFVSIVVFIAFVAFAILLIYCTWPQKQPDLQDLLGSLKKQTTTTKEQHIVKRETTTSRNVPVCDVWGRVVTPSMTTTETSSTTQMSNLPESYVVSQEDMDKILTTVALTARKDALDEYKENFSILLAILAVFGIAWPAIVALLQFRFNEGELKKIKEAEKKANKANSIAKNMKDQLKDVTEKTNTLWAASIEMQLLKDEFKNFKHELCSELPSIYLSLSIFHARLPEMNNATTLDHHRVAELMRLSRLFYFCIDELTGKDKIENCYINLIQELNSLDERIKAGEKMKMTYNETLFEDFDWNVIEQRLEPAKYTELKELCDKVFLAKGEK